MHSVLVETIEIGISYLCFNLQARIWKNRMELNIIDFINAPYIKLHSFTL